MKSKFLFLFGCNIGTRPRSSVLYCNLWLFVISNLLSCQRRNINLNCVQCFLDQIDEQLASGEFFMSDTKKSSKKWQEKQEKQAQKIAESKRKREAAFIPPEVVVWSYFSPFSAFYRHLNLFSFMWSFINLGMAISGAEKPGFKIWGW